jgi:hypothetical protein
VLSALATACAGLGDVEGAEAAARELDRLIPFPFTRPEQDLGRAWARVAAGDLPGARRILADAAGLAATTGYRICEAWLRHDVARLGEPAGVVDRLAELAGECEGELVAAYAAHATAAAAGDPGRPGGRGRRLRAVGRPAAGGRGRERGGPGVAARRRPPGGRPRSGSGRRRWPVPARVPALPRSRPRSWWSR